MKAIAKCPKCGKVLTTNCKGCIDNGDYACAERECSCELTPKTKIDWEKIPETPEELEEVDKDEY